ncbi:MAG TPA: hypothetical protein VED84_07020 [Acidimicrobiales bacterium]|nr:hypothetical protein [Acidimicrobiales bacterium]
MRLARCQARLEPLQIRIVAGCRLTRDPARLTGQTGFEIVELESGYRTAPKPRTCFSRGVAANPERADAAVASP